MIGGMAIGEGDCQACGDKLLADWCHKCGGSWHTHAGACVQKRDAATVCAWAAMPTPLSTPPHPPFDAQPHFDSDEDALVHGPLVHMIDVAFGSNPERDAACRYVQEQCGFFRTSWRAGDAASGDYARYVVANLSEFPTSQLVTAKLYLDSGPSKCRLYRYGLPMPEYGQPSGLPPQ